MSTTIWINIRTGNEMRCNEEDHSAMLEFSDELDALSEVLGVAKLSSFHDHTDLEFNLDIKNNNDDEDIGDDDDVDSRQHKDDQHDEEWAVDDAEWFPAADALAAIVALLDHLTAKPQAISRRHGWTQAEVMEELEDCRTELTQAESENLPFHFALIM